MKLGTLKKPSSFLASHPAGVRGLKQFNQQAAPIGKTVAPRRGARIETCQFCPEVPKSFWVAPRRGAWIETSKNLIVCVPVQVAPRRGAWIETGHSKEAIVFSRVAPRRGAWIETSARCKPLMKAMRSHPAGVRGLKPDVLDWSHDGSKSHPAGVRGLKLPAAGKY